jgi:eukaryotic-like serine/threonine-protein kinase
MAFSLQDQLQQALGDAYQIEREIGVGGMSTVFSAVETSLGRHVAIKVLQPELTADLSAERFTREVRLAASLQQANIVPLLSAGTANGFSYYTMPLVSGSSLRARLATSDAVPLAEAVSILRDVARALAYAHSSGVVHRDIKPDNILLSGGTAVVSDFGIAKAMENARTGNAQTFTNPGSALGTPGYMAPEQVAADAVDSRSDIYAWGVVAWELLAHRHPFGRHESRQAMMAAHLTEEAPALDHVLEVPTPLAMLVMRCLAKDPDRRPQTASEILSILDSVVTPAMAHAARPKPPRRIVMVVAGVATLAAAFVATQQFRQKPAVTPAATNIAPSVAVLPFENIGGDTAQEYFADGMTDELATALGRLPGLRVAARSAAYRYKGRRDIDVRQVGSDLGVKYLLSGSVRRTGQTIRLSAVLTESSGATEIWSNSYTRPAADVLALQDSLTMAITAALADRLGPPGSVTPTGPIKRGTTSREAYDLWLKGNYYLNRRRPGLEGAVRSFEAAIAEDPNYARPYAGLANALALLTYFGEKPLDQDRVTQNAQHALLLDSTQADAYVGLGIMHMSVARFDVAEKDLRAAIAIDPQQNAAAHFQLGRCLMYVGRVDEAVDAFERAKSIEPYQATTATWLGFTATYSSTPERGRDEAARAWDLDSSSAVVQIVAAMTAFNDGRPADALHVIRSSPTRSVMNQGAFAYILGMTGSPDSARAVIREIEARGAARWNDYVSLMVAALAVPDTTKALDALEKGYARGEAVTAWWPLWSRVFDPIRQAPRFVALARRAGVDYAARSPKSR